MGQTSHTEWRVLLIGGASGVGKTMAARRLAHRLRISHLYVDDVRMALQRATTLEQQPQLHYFLQPHIWHQPPDALIAGFIGVSDALVPALEAIIAHHVGVLGLESVLIEGDGIAPSLAATTTLHHLLFGGSLRLAAKLRAVFVEEPDKDVLLSNMRARERGFGASPPDEQRHIAHVCWLFGNWLAAEAHARGVPVVPARPFSSLPTRILAAVEP